MAGSSAPLLIRRTDLGGEAGRSAGREHVECVIWMLRVQGHRNAVALLAQNLPVATKAIYLLCLRCCDVSYIQAVLQEHEVVCWHLSTHTWCTAVASERRERSLMAVSTSASASSRKAGSLSRSQRAAARARMRAPSASRANDWERARHASLPVVQ